MDGRRANTENEDGAMEGDRKFHWGLLWQEWSLAQLGILVILPLLYVKGFTGWEMVRGSFFLMGLFLVGIMDIRYGLIFNRFLLVMGAAGIGLDVVEPRMSFGDVLEGAALGFSLLCLIRWGSRGGMGGGDVKYAAVLGLWLGWKLLLVALFLAFVLGSVAAAWMLLVGRRGAIPFGPFLSLGAGTAFLWGIPLLRWYEGYLP